MSIICHQSFPAIRFVQKLKMDASVHGGHFVVKKKIFFRKRTEVFRFCCLDGIFQILFYQDIQKNLQSRIFVRKKYCITSLYVPKPFHLIFLLTLKAICYCVAQIQCVKIKYSSFERTKMANPKWRSIFFNYLPIRPRLVLWLICRQQKTNLLSN